MACKLDGLVRIGDASSDLGGPERAIRDASPQALPMLKIYGELGAAA